VAVLDRRLVTKGYGRAFRATLPPSPLLRSVEEAQAWWSSIALRPGPGPLDGPGPSRT
jgi:hypothetical protein